MLQAKEWYIIADNDDSHIKDSHIKFGKFIQSVKSDEENFVNGERLLDEVKQIINP